MADARAKASGIYSLTGPGFAITPFATAAPTTNPLGLAATDSTVYSLDLDAGVVSIDTAAPFTQKSVRLKFPARLQRSLAKRLRKYRTASVMLTLRPEDGKGHALGQPLTMTVTLTR